MPKIDWRNLDEDSEFDNFEKITRGSKFESDVDTDDRRDHKRKRNQARELKIFTQTYGVED